MHATALANCDSWWRGPLFLQDSEDAWPNNKVFDTPLGDPEVKHSAPRGMKSNRREPEVDEMNAVPFLHGQVARIVHLILLTIPVG